MRPWRILLEPQGGEGGGDGGTTTTTTTQAEAKGPDLKKSAENLVAKHGDPTAALLVLLGENFKEREKVRELSARVPASDAVVLAGDDAKDWSHYKVLGKPADLRRSLSERDQYKGEADGFRTEAVHRQAAEILGYKPSVLSRLAKDVEIVVDHLKDDKGVPIGTDGKVLAKDAAPVPMAFVKGEGDRLTRLDEHANSAWKDFLPSLKAEAAEKPKGTPRIGGEGNRANPAGQGSGGATKRPRPNF